MKVTAEKQKQKVDAHLLTLLWRLIDTLCIGADATLHLSLSPGFAYSLITSKILLSPSRLLIYVEADRQGSQTYRNLSLPAHARQLSTAWTTSSCALLLKASPTHTFCIHTRNQSLSTQTLFFAMAARLEAHQAKSPYDALQDAYTAAIHARRILQTEGPAATPQQQRKAADAWAAEYLTKSGAPPGLVQDCTRWISTTAASTAEATQGGGGTFPTAPSEATSHSTVVCANPYESYYVESDSSGSGSPGSNAGGNKAQVALNPSLDVDHCTLARILRDEDEQWRTQHEVRDSPVDAVGARATARAFGLSPPSVSPPPRPIRDIFSDEAVQREAWQCWAAVLRDVKIEAVVQQQDRRSRELPREEASMHPALNGLLDYLEAPETPWLMEDHLSSVLMATDLYMANRAYATAGNEVSHNASREVGDDDENVLNAMGKVGRDTHDMKAVHEYLLQQDVDEPPLRSLLSLTLASHIGSGQ